MVVRQEFRLVQLLIRFENPVLDHFERAAGALARTEILEHEWLLPLPVVVEGRIVGIGRHDRVGNQLVLERVLADAVDEGRQPFARLTVAPIYVDQVRDRGGHRLGRQLDRHLADLGRAVHLAAQVQFVHRDRVLADPLPDTVQADRRNMMLRAGIVAAADLDAHVLEILRNAPGREHFRQGAREPFGGGDAEAAGVGPRAGDDVFDQFGAGIGQPLRRQVGIQRLDLRLRNPADDHVLVDRRADVAVGVPFGQIRNVQHLLRGEIPHEQLDHRRDVAVLFLPDDVGPFPHFKRGLLRPAVGMAVALGCGLGSVRRSRHDQTGRFILMLQQLDRPVRRSGMAHRHEGLFPAPLELGESELLDHEFHAGLVPVLTVPQLVEHLDDSLDAGDQLVHRREVPQHLRDPRQRAEAAARDHAEADRAVRGLRRQQADVVDRRQGAIVRAAGEGDLELAGQALVERVPQQMVGHRLGIGGHVEDLAPADPGEMAGRDVPDGIGAGLSRRQPDFREPAHDRRHVLQLGEMQLDILPRGHMSDAGCVALRQFRDAPQLIRRNAPERNFDAHHLHAGLALAVDAVLQPKRFEEIAHNLTGEHPYRLFLEGFDLFENRGRDRFGLDGNVVRSGWAHG